MANRAWNPRGLHDLDALRSAVAGRTALVTGASFGLGESTARLLAEAGATVLLVARTEARLREIAGEITAAGGHAFAYPADLTVESDVESLVERLEADHPAIDIVVSNAGKSIRRPLHLQYDRYRDFTQTSAINYLGPVRLLLGLLPGMRARGQGHIINISTVGARVVPTPRWGAYQASKSAFDVWLRSITPELRMDGVQVSSLYMALIHTRMSAPTPSINRVPGLLPEEAAELVATAIVEGKRRIEPWWLVPLELASVVLHRPMERIVGASYRRGDDLPATSGRRGDARRAPRAPDRELVTEAVRTLWRAGMLAPMGPARLRAVRAAARWGSSMASIAAVSAARWPDRVAFVDEHATLTYRELDGRAHALAARLVADRAGGDGAIGILCRNHHWFAETVLAAGRLGRDVVLLNTDFSDHQVASSVSRFGISELVHDSALASKVRGVTDAHLLVADGPADQEDSVEHLIALGSGSVPPPERNGRIVILTSGTTGSPKGVPRDTDGKKLAGPMVSLIDRLGLRQGEVVLIAPPLFHGFGMGYLGVGLALGATMVVHERFDADVVLDAVEEHGVTTLAVVPVMLQRLLRAGGRERASSLRAVLTGGAPLSPVLAAEFMGTFGPILFNGYGSSEAGIVSVATPADLHALPGTVGRPVLGAEVRIVDDDGACVTPGSIGRITVGSALVVAEAGTDHARPTDTGDQGYLSADGRLVVVGRSDDMVISGGENVYPQVLENALSTHPGVADVAVVGVDDPEFGQRLRAFVVPRTHDLTPEALIEFARERVARFETPREVVFLDALPRNPTGKILLNELRALEPS